ncbi:MAG TPA: DUF885 family protein, partial [Blastocatellia bacterium]|nr:DUF885 family protein [Blastocatellia bacterium]
MKETRSLVISGLIAALILSASLPAQSVFAFSPSQKSANGNSTGAAVVESNELDELRSSQSELRGVIERHVADRGNLFRFYTAQTSPNRNARLRQFYSGWLAVLAKIDFSALSHDGKIDYLLFKNYLDHELRQLDIRAKALAEASQLLPFAGTISDLEDSRRRMEPIDSPKTAALLTTLNKRIEEARKQTEAGLKPSRQGAPAAVTVKKTVANRAALTINSLRNTLRNWFAFYNGYDPVFTWWTGEPYKAVDKSLETYAAFLREKVVGVKPGDEGAIIGDPIGREALMSELAFEMIPYTPEELVAIARREMAWCENEMKRASRDLGYGDDWRKALEHVKNLYVEPGKQPELIRDLALEAIAFIDKHDLVTVPALARDTW